MAFRGQVFEYVVGLGGYDSQLDRSRIDPRNLSLAEHVALDLDVARTRGGKTAYNATPIAGGPRVLGAFDFWLQNTTQLFPVAAGARLYGAAGGAITSLIDPGGLTGGKPTWFTQAWDQTLAVADLLFAFNGVDPVQVWTGSGTTGGLSVAPADWATTHQPTFGLPFLTRLFAFGVDNRPSFLYGSKPASPKDYTTGVGNAVLFDQWGQPITAMGIISTRLFTFSPFDIFYLDTTSTDATAWRYQCLYASGGTLSPYAVIPMVGDLVFLGPDGLPRSLTAFQQLGDFQQAIIAGPLLTQYMHDHLNVAQLPNTWGIFDPSKRCLYFALAVDGSTTNNVLLKGYLAPIGQQPRIIRWTLDPGVAAACLFLRRVTGVERPFLGDYAGQVHALDQATYDDNGAGYVSRIRSGESDFGLPGRKKLYRSVDLVQQPLGNWSGIFDFYLDGQLVQSQAFAMVAGGALDSFILDVDKLASLETTTTRLPLAGVGERFMWEVRQPHTDQAFSVAKVRVNYVPGGTAPFAQVARGAG